jgi:hypothetical protein
MPTKRLVCRLILACSLPWVGSRCTAVSAARAAGVPPLEAMAGEWFQVSELAHMPTLHNFHEMAACAPDLLGVNYNPGEQLFDWPVGPRWFRYRTLPLATMTVDGESLESQTCRWEPYQALRRATSSGLVVETAVRLPFESLGVLYCVRLTNETDQPRTTKVAFWFPGVPSAAVGGSATYARSQGYAIDYSFASVGGSESNRLSAGNADGSELSWSPSIAPGQTVERRFVMLTGAKNAPPDEAGVTRQAKALADAFDDAWQAAEDGWKKRWSQAFTPGNAHFSGNLPVLDTDDAAIREIYYRSVLTLLVLHRTNLAMCDRVFITSGERASGVVFFWDTSMWSKVFALLEPRGMKEQLRLFLKCDPHRGPVCSMVDGSQWDGWYAANDLTIFQLATTYLAVTGDYAFLDETIGETKVIDLLERLATNWKKLQRDKSVLLADYGENANLLECAPAYVHRVPSFNAANVDMMRTAARIREMRGDAVRAAELRKEADELSASVLKLYKPGDGVWYALHRDGKRVELRHCYDFVNVGRYMAGDLNPEIRIEMVDFVRRELLADQWMRAMSPRDEAAKASDRPDHGPLGAFDAWPALTVETMCLLDAWGPAVDFLRRTAGVLDEGVYGQAREFYGPRRYERDAPVRIAMRGACMRECVGGGAFAEVIIGTLFGFTPRIGEDDPLLKPTVARGIQGELRGVRFRERTLDVRSGESGLSTSLAN